jgi:hypothetical protein
MNKNPLNYSLEKRPSNPHIELPDKISLPEKK